MGLFSRNKEAVPVTQADDVPFETLRRSPRRQRGASGTDFDASAPLDPSQASRARARHRLIGAIALGLAAIVFVPMLFDRTPVAPADDISLQIPDRDAPFEGRRGVPSPSRGPLRPTTELPLVTPGTPPAAIVDAPPPIASTSAEPSAPDVAPKTAVVSPKPAETSSPKTTEKVVPPPAKAGVADDPRALAALEGKTDAPAPEPAGSKGYAVQIAAYSAAERARGMRDQLVSGGLKSYTESVSTAQGLRTRVRLGPFATRDAAERARQKLKTMKLDGSVVPL